MSLHRYPWLEVIYGGTDYTGLAARVVAQVNTGNNREHGQFLDQNGEVLFKLVDHSEVKFGFQAESEKS